jgi:hypothetical protein
MLKRILLLIVSLVVLFLSPGRVEASEEFKIDVTTNYRVEPQGIVEVTQKIRIENLVSDLYATSFAIELDNIDPIAPHASENGQPISLESKKADSKTILIANFPEALVGRGRVRNFEIVFSEDSFATRTGEIWEIAIPRLSDEANFDSYALFLIVPESFGQEAYISPEPESRVSSEGETVYAFSQDSVSKSGITAGFGQFQVFSYVLNYHLENPIAKSAEVDIAIPPDTAFQKVYVSTIDPKPNNVYMDSDGNWLATYLLSPKQRIDVSVKGAVQIFASPRPFFKPTREELEENLKPSEFWQVEDPRIINLAKELKTPEEIYKYVADTLSYDYERVRPNVARLGALSVLENPTQAICMEYTDLFIALARAAGIPAREVNGYAYSENPDIQPLSLVADVLHAWPEYYDYERGAWIPIDPTWGSTTGGVDYFNKLDLRHFTFVIHGKDPQVPFPPGSYKLGPNPQKDVFVNFGQLPEKKTTTPKLELTPTAFSLSGRSFNIEIQNPGPVAIYDSPYYIYFDQEVHTKERIDVLLPFSNYQTQVRVPFSFLAKKTPGVVSVELVGSRVYAPINKTQILAVQLLLIFIAITVFVVAVYLRFKKISVLEVATRVKNRIIGLKVALIYAVKTKIFKKPQNPI